MAVSVQQIKDLLKENKTDNKFIYVNTRVYQEVMEDVDELNSQWGFSPAYEWLGITLRGTPYLKYPTALVALEEDPLIIPKPSFRNNNAE